MMIKNNSFYPSVLFVAIISSYILAYSILKPIWLSGINFSMLFLLISIIYLVAIKRFYLIGNCFRCQNDVIILSIVIIAAWTINPYIRTGSIAPITEISGNILFQTLTEELVFRVAMLGLFIEMIPLKKHQSNYFQCYWTEGKQNSTKLLAIMLLISIIFSNLHFVWVYDPQDLITRSIRGMVYAFAFVLTNKKIYLPCILHYINNIYV